MHLGGRTKSGDRSTTPTLGAARGPRLCLIQRVAAAEVMTYQNAHLTLKELEEEYELRVRNGLKHECALMASPLPITRERDTPSDSSGDPDAAIGAYPNNARASASTEQGEEADHSSAASRQRIFHDVLQCHIPDAPSTAKDNTDEFRKWQTHWESRETCLSQSDFYYS